MRKSKSKTNTRKNSKKEHERKGKLRSPKAVKKSVEKSQVHRELYKFIQYIESLNTSIDLVMLVMSVMLEQSVDCYNRFLKKHGKQKGVGKRAVFEIGATHQNELEKLKRDLERADLSHNILPESFLVSLVSKFDFFVGRLISCLFERKPQLLSSSERKLSFYELNKLKSIKKARDFLMEKEIEAVLRKSHSDQFKWLQNRFDIELKKGLDVWPVFIELTERRNLFVHCNGIVTSQYLDVCRSHGVAFDSSLKKGQKLGVPPDYFKKAFSCLFEIAVKLSQVLWRKVLTEELEYADASLSVITYDLLKSKQYDIAAKLLDFACSEPMKYPSDVSRRVHIINKAIAYKWQGAEDKCRAIIEQEDWTSCSEEFTIAVVVLSDRFKEAADIMKQIGKDGKVGEIHYTEWPLFDKFRSSKLFIRAFEQIFGHPFVAVKTAAPTIH